MNNYTVYQHTFPNGKKYIGMTCQKNLNRRWDAGRGYKTQVLMARAIEKYGWDNVRHEVLATGLTKEDAEKMEIEQIRINRTADPEFGYNIENGGNCPGTHSEETKRKIGDAQRGEKNHCYGKPSPFKGVKRTPEEIEKNRQAHLGIPSCWKGKHLPPHVVEQLRRPKTEEHKRKLSEAKSVPVVCIETGVIYPSGKAAAEAIGISRGGIAYAVKGERKSAGGYHWALANVKEAN